MLSSKQIQKLAALTLCLLYTIGVGGMTLCSCHCTDSKQLSVLSNHTSCTSQECCKSCCSAESESPDEAASTPDNAGLSLSKGLCCMASINVLKAEHQAEQPKLLAGFISIALPSALLPSLYSSIEELASVETSIECYFPPPKVPLIYQIACLRL